MSECPHCGTATPADSPVCPACGVAVPKGGDRRAGPSRPTQVGVGPSSRGVPGTTPPAAPPHAAHATLLGITPAMPPGTPAGAGRDAVSRTMLGLPSPQIAPPGAGGAAAPPVSAPAAAPGGMRTMVGMPAAELAPPAAGAAPPGAANPTMIGVAMPGIAPLAPGAAPPVAANPTMIGVAMPGIAPLHAGHPPPDVGLPLEEHADDDGEVGEDVPAAGRRRSRRGRARALLVVSSAGVLAVAAILFALFWRSAPPVVARAAIDAEGRDVLDVACGGCPDGTVLSIGERRATVIGGRAQVALAAPLAVGDNRLVVAVDRPQGRDEKLSLTVPVRYRIRPDLADLQGERPAIGVEVEAVAGALVWVDGEPVPLTGGRGARRLDVSAECTGSTFEARTLSRSIPFRVRSPDGGEETGKVDVSVGVVPLRIEAPGSRAVTETEHFLLAGRTAKGAELTAAGAPIPVSPDGTFAQRMKVRSVGSTTIEVRSRLAGKAPRLVRLEVSRVASLDEAAREHEAKATLRYPDLARDVAAGAGRLIVVRGEVIEARRQDHQTIVVLDVGKECGAARCLARLVRGGDERVTRGDRLTAYGRVLGPFSADGHGTLPEIEVDFIRRARP